VHIAAFSFLQCAFTCLPTILSLHGNMSLLYHTASTTGNCTTIVLVLSFNGFPWTELAVNGLHCITKVAADGFFERALALFPYRSEALHSDRSFPCLISTAGLANAAT